MLVVAFDKGIHVAALSIGRLGRIKPRPRRRRPRPSWLMSIPLRNGTESPTLMVTQCLERKSCQRGVQGRKLLDNSGAEGTLLTMRGGERTSASILDFSSGYAGLGTKL